MVQVPAVDLEISEDKDVPGLPEDMKDAVPADIGGTAFFFIGIDQKNKAGSSLGQTGSALLADTYIYSTT